jgi:integrase
MAKRTRGQGEGSIYESDGRWRAVVSLPNGKRKYLSGRTREETSRKLTVLLKQVQDGLPATSDQKTISSFSKEWLAAVKPTVAPNTYRRYEGVLRVNVLPSLGKIRLSRLQASHLQQLYSDCIESGLSPRTVHHIHTVTHTMLDKAARWDFVQRNVASLVSPPKVPHREMITLSVEEVRALLTTARGTRLEAIWSVAIGTGLRAGELLALRWQDIDLKAASLNVTATLTRQDGELVRTDPKTARSRRRVALSIPTVTALGTHRTVQLEERVKAGPAWQDGDFVFTNRLGGPIDQSNLLKREFRPLLQKAGVRPDATVRDLRHTAISLALSQGTAATDVSEMAGHSNVGVTLSVYAHALPGAPKRATDAIAAAIAGA